MESKNQIKLFESHEIRTEWNEDLEEWFFSIIDVISILTESKNPNRYWSDLKKKLKEESGQPYENIVRLKLKAPDGKMRLTDSADTKQLLRIIQSIPSPKAEPFKKWLAQLGHERLDEIADPEKAIDRALDTYRAKGYSEAWINQRLKSKEIRKDMTDEWDRSGVKQGIEYAILTNEVSNACFEIDTKEHKQLKGLKKGNLRDNMSNAELVINMLAELSTTEISKTENPKGFEESKDIAQRGGNIAGDARKNLEKQTGKKVVTSRNAKNPELLDDNN